MDRIYRLFRIAGFTLYIHITLIILLAFILIIQLLNGFWPFVYGLSLSIFLVISVLLHELGHALASKYYGNPVYAIVLHLFGGYAQMGMELSRKERMITALAGPCINFLLFSLGLLTYLVFSSLFLKTLFEGFLWANLTLFLFNILPVSSLDGGIFVHLYLEKQWGPLQARFISLKLSFISILVIVLISLITHQVFLLLIAGYIGFENYREWTLLCLENHIKPHFPLTKNDLIQFFKWLKHKITNKPSQ